MQSFPQAINRIKSDLLSFGPDWRASTLAQEFTADARPTDSIGIALISNLAESWEGLRGIPQFVFVNRDDSVVHAGFGCAPYRVLSSNRIVFVGCGFEEREISEQMIPLVLLSTDWAIWPTMTVSVTAHRSVMEDVVAILDALAQSFIPRNHAQLIPPCVKYQDTGMSEDAYTQSVNRVLTDIESGSLQKVVLARRVSFDMASSLNSFALLQTVLEETESSDGGKRYIACYKDETDRTFVSLTPELLCRVDGNEIRTEALAGTCGNVDGFAMTEKLYNEHESVSTYISDTLSTLGSTPVEITSREYVRLRDLTHCRQTLSMKADSLSASFLVDWAIANLHPTPAVCGVPLAAAANVIRECEGFPRGAFAAPIGIVDPATNSGELCVALRSAVIEGRSVHVYAGAGIVAGSDPAAEWLEMELKMKQFKSVLTEVSRPVFTALDAQCGFPHNATEAVANFTVEELVRQGVSCFIVCPGSRSTPLTTAVHRNSVSRSRCIVIHDERCAGFYAVGIARGGGLAAIIVTSGTAVANLMPAVCEAREAGLALVLLTADRPSQSWDVGECQTVKQANMFSSLVGFERNFPAPCSEAPKLLASAGLKSILADVSFGVGEVAKNRKQSVHFNFEFHKSELQPVVVEDGFVDAWRKSLDEKIRRYCLTTDVYTTHVNRSGAASIPVDVIKALSTKSCLVVCGELRDPIDAISLTHFCNANKVPCVAEATSLMIPSEFVLMGVDQVIADKRIQAMLGDGVEVILRVGGPLISARLQDWSSTLPDCHVVRVQDDSFSRTRHDPQWAADIYVHASLTGFLTALPHFTGRPMSKWFTGLTARMGQLYREALGATAPEFNEAVIAANVDMEAWNADASIFLSSSMPCRDFALFGSLDPPDWPHRLVACNRGANGIDGVISSAAGYAVATKTPVYLLIGDVATVHDFGGLAVALNVHPGASGPAPDVKVICVNNSGGAIFSFLPIKAHTDLFNPYFDTPHSLSLSAIAGSMAPGAAVRVSDQRSLRGALRDPNVKFIECVDLPDHATNVAIHKQIGSTVIQQLV